MQVGMVGLGRMGANMARRLMRDGHGCVVYDVRRDAVDALASDGAQGCASLGELVASLQVPRLLWLMLPAALVGATLDALLPLLTAGDTVVDGGNSHFREAIARAGTCSASGIDFLDVGTSGGVWGLEHGYCLMVGGRSAAVQRLEPVLRSLAPEPAGWLRCGGPGAGHFVKMVHNGIEYGMMAAYAEGFALLARAGAGHEVRAADAETAPLADAETYRFDFDVAAIAQVWRRGSVIRSWVLDLAARALERDPGLDAYSGEVSDSGEGRWTLKAAIDLGVPMPALSAALFARFDSRGEDLYAGKVLSALREEFGGHRERTARTK